METSRLATVERVRPTLFELVAVYLFYAGAVARTLSWNAIRPLLPIYLGLELVYLVLFSLILWRSTLRPLGLYLYFAFQTLLVLFLFSLWTDFNFVLVLLVPLCYQSAHVFRGQIRQWWTGALILLIGIAMTATRGIGGLAEGMLPMAGGLIFVAYVIVHQEITLAGRQSQAMLKELQATHQKLEAYSTQVEELSALNERNRLARELHDSVSQNLFGILLNTRSAQILVERDPSRVRSQLEQLQEATQNCLVEMRKFITQLRPKNP